MRFAALKTIVNLGVMAIILTGCGGGDKENKDLADTYAYKTDGPYSGTIARCIRTERNHCNLATLPVLGMDFNDPGIPQIMERVVVSHDWMGERFEELLYELPSEMLPLFKGVTAIVIDADIRPAYYTAATGAIYLDPAFLWLSVSEKRTINPKEDFRAGFDDPLAFRKLQRYLKGGQPAFRWASLTDNSSRELEDIVLLASSLLLHELAHANDFIPPYSYDDIDVGDTVAVAAEKISNQWLSTRLTDLSPLTSDTMFSLASVMYQGETPTIDDLEISATGVGEAFMPDGAADDYGYTTQFEDFAMLFETAMMKYFYDADYEMAFTSVPDNPSLCSDFQIGWGVRGRIGDEHVKPRAMFAVNELLPNLDHETFFAALDAPTEISGDWCLASTINLTESQKVQAMEVPSIERRRPFL